MFALVFPGQGSQRPAMGAAWRDHPSWAVVERLSSEGGPDLARLLLDADAEELRRTGNSQPATFALCMVILDAARTRLGDGPAATAGHSLGEYGALVAAGALDLPAAMRLVGARADAMQAAADAAPGTMVAVLGLEPDAVVRACAAVEGAWPANDNAPGQYVVAGTPEGVAAAGEAALALGARRVLPLPVGGAFHSPLMAPAQERLDAALAGVELSPTRVPVMANVDAVAHRDGFAPLLSAQLVSRVRWRESLLALSAAGIDTFCELGPGAELSGMVKRTLPDAHRVSVAGPEDLERLAGIA